MNESIGSVKFSIITIVYNEVKYIQDTILSVLNQEYKNIEYILIDGASSDGTVDVVNKYLLSIDKFVSEKDAGIYDAMNKGLSHCTGDYVIFMNGGDSFFNEKVLLDIDLHLDNNNSDFLYGDSYVRKSLSESLLYKKSRNCNYYWYGMFTNHQAMFYKLSIVKQYKLEFDTSYKVGADYKFTLQFLKICDGRLYINLPVCVFSLDGVSNTQKDLGFSEANKARIEVLSYGRYSLRLIKILIYTARFIEENARWLHTLLRFSRKYVS